jgi:23S rRNA (adenine2030-N6)-methyltransferase
MNYRHIFHAGNICDVVKHVTLVALLAHLRAKPAPFCVIDTHAGIGLYDLQDPRAQKTAEAQNGILKLLAAPPHSGLAEYYDVLQNFNGGTLEDLRFYPGSPLFIASLMRAEDRLAACELHEEDARILKRQAGKFPQIQVHHRDGYEALHAFLPPPEKRGLVLIDPPYESPEEFARLAQAVLAAHQRWPQGMFMIWYPVKERPAVWRFHDAMTAADIPRQLCAEFIYEEETRHDRLNGCGILLINPPWKSDKELTQLFPALHGALQTTHRGATVEWLTPDS